MRAGFAQADVALDHLDDVGLLLDGLGEVGHGVCIEDKAPGCGGAGLTFDRMICRIAIKMRRSPTNSPYRRSSP